MSSSPEPSTTSPALPRNRACLCCRLVPPVSRDRHHRPQSNLTNSVVDARKWYDIRSTLVSTAIEFDPRSAMASSLSALHVRDRIVTSANTQTRNRTIGSRYWKARYPALKPASGTWNPAVVNAAATTPPCLPRIPPLRRPPLHSDHQPGIVLPALHSKPITCDNTRSQRLLPPRHYTLRPLLPKKPILAGLAPRLASPTNLR